MTREGSEEIVHRCSLVIVFSALLHNIRSISDQRRLRGDCTQVQSCHSPSAPLHNIRSISDQRRLRGDCTQVQSCHSLPCFLTQYKEYK